MFFLGSTSLISQLLSKFLDFALILLIHVCQSMLTVNLILQSDFHMTSVLLFIYAHYHGFSYGFCSLMISACISALICLALIPLSYANTYMISVHNLVVFPYLICLYIYMISVHSPVVYSNLICQYIYDQCA